MTRQDPYSERSHHHIGIIDAVFLAIVAVGGYFATSHSDGTSTAFASPAHAADRTAQQICSDEELRQMRSGPETCYVPIGADKHEFSLKPSS